MMAWTKEQIHDLLDRSDKAVLRAVVAIKRYQTTEELNTLSTKDSNGVGFGAFDAEFLTKIAES